MEPKQAPRTTDSEAVIREVVLAIEQDVRDLLQQHLRELDVLLLDQVTRILREKVPAATPAVTAPSPLPKVDPAPTAATETPVWGGESLGYRHGRRISARQALQIAGVVLVFFLGWLSGRGFGPRTSASDKAKQAAGTPHATPGIPQQTGQTSASPYGPVNTPASGAAPAGAFMSRDLRVIALLAKAPQEWAARRNSDRIRTEVKVLDRLTPSPPQAAKKKATALLSLRNAIDAFHAGKLQTDQDDRIVVALLQLKLIGENSVDGSLTWTALDKPEGTTAPVLSEYLNQRFLPSLGLSRHNGDTLVVTLAQVSGAPAFPELLRQLERAVLLREFFDWGPAK